MPGQAVNPENFTPAIGAYSHGVTFDIGGTRLLFVTGQIAIDQDGKLISKDIEEQTRFVFENVGQILGAAGMSFLDVLKVQIFLTDMRDFQKVSAIRNRYLGQTRPASTLVEVSRLVKDGCKIEVEAIAARSG